MTVTPLPGALLSSDVAAFLDTLVDGASAVAFDGDIPTAPDRLYVVASTGGPGLDVEYAYDVVSMQIRSRGMQGQGAGKSAAAADAETLAWTADQALLGVARWTAIGNQHVNLVTRVGSPPSYLTRDPAGRVHYVCSYLFHTARSF